MEWYTPLGVKSITKDFDSANLGNCRFESCQTTPIYYQGDIMSFLQIVLDTLFSAAFWFTLSLVLLGLLIIQAEPDVSVDTKEDVR